MHPAVAFGQEPDALVVGQELHGGAAEPAAPGLAHPRIVVQQVDDAGLAGFGIERHVPAVLVVGRAGGRDDVLAVIGDDGHRPPDVAFRPARGPALGNGRPRCLGGLLASGVRDRRREAAIGEHALAGLEVQDAEQPAVLRVADVRPRRNVLGVGGLGDVVRHDGRLHADRALGNHDKDVGVVGREHQIGGRLAILELEGRQPVLLLLVLGLLLVGLLFLDKVDELLFLVAQEALAVGQPRLGPPWRDVGQLRQKRRPAAVDRGDEQVALARPRDVGVVARPPRIGLGPACLRDLAPVAGHGVNQDDVATVYKEDAAASLVPAAAGGRRDVLDLVVGQLARCPARAADGVGRGLVLGRLAPVEVELLGVARPPEAGRRISDEVRAAHDVVDGQLEPAVRDSG